MTEKNKSWADSPIHDKIKQSDYAIERTWHNYKETQYGFEYGAATLERKCSDDKKGWVCLGIETPRATLSVYVTKTGKVRIHDQKTGQELLPANKETQ